MSFGEDARDRFLRLTASMDGAVLTSCAQNMLGDIKTPCKKAELAKDLCLWFSSDENVDFLIASIDVNARRMVSTLAVMGGTPSFDNIAEIRCEMRPSAVRAVLQSLEDRLIVVRTGDSRYTFNPLIKERLLAECFDASLVGETRTEFQPPKTFGPCLGREFLRALVNLMLSGEFPTREANRHYFYNGTAIRTCFPSIPQELVASLIRHVSAFLIAEGFVTARNYRFHVSRAKFQRFLSLSMEQKILTFVQNEYDVNSSLAASHVLTLSRCMPMSVDFFRKVIHCVCTTYTCPDSEGLLFGITLESGAVCIHDGAVYANPDFFEPYPPVTEFRIDSDMTVTYRGTSSADDILYLCGDLVSCDTMVSYRITKDSYFRARNEGVSPKEISEAFRTAETAYLFPLYEDAYSRIKVYQGIVIKTGEQYSSVFESIPQISENIVEKIAPGVYLMDSDNQDRWAEIVSKALDIASIPATITTKSKDEGSVFSIAAPPSRKLVLANVEHDSDKAAEKLREDARSKGILNDAVEQLIDSRIIVAPSQLDRRFTYVAGMSAAGFTYSAKETIFKTALKKAGTMLRIEIAEECLFATVSAIEKDGSGNAYATVDVMPDGEQRRIKISSVFKVTAMRRCVR